MKVLNREQIQLADEHTIKNEPIQSINLMERASKAFCTHFISRYKNTRGINIFCGTGNNGGDGLAVSRLLIEQSYKVNTFIVKYSANFSADFQTNEKRLLETANSNVAYLDENSELPLISSEAIIIDALWGTGLNRQVSGFGAIMINHINASGAETVAIDIPSGIFCDEYNSDDVKIKAHLTITFQFPKFSFFMPENQDHLGEVIIADIGLDQAFMSALTSPFHYIDKGNILQIYRPRKKFAHKGHFGHVLIFSGSYGKIGAVLLSARGALKSGSGLVTAYIPQCGYEIMQSALPECMVICDQNYEYLSDIPDLKGFNVIATGPGLGQDYKTAEALNKMLINYNQPMVIDADGINLMASNPDLLNQLPENSILTPHIGEFDRLTGKSENHYERISRLIEFSSKYKCVTVLKGHYTAICTPDGTIYFNPTGNPGMATGGSGDVLTGVIAGLLAQKYTPAEAAILGVYMHGLAGDIMASELSEEALIAGDIINGIPAAYKSFHQL